ncbi:hypothetical protein MAR_016053, partial [Mya arenaria]
QRKRKLKEAKQDFVYKHKDGLPNDLAIELLRLYFMRLDNDDWGDKIEDLENLYTATSFNFTQRFRLMDERREVWFTTYTWREQQCYMSGKGYGPTEKAVRT